MKCQYYIAPTLDIAHRISDDLHAIGMDDWYIHVVSRDEAGLQERKIHSSNYVERSDAFSGAVAGAIVGLIAGGLTALVLNASPVGGGVSMLVYAMVVLAPAAFGLWEGALLRSKYGSRKIALFHDAIAAGRYLFLIYTPEDREEAVERMMRKKHPSVELVAVDEHFMDPFTGPKRIS